MEKPSVKFNFNGEKREYTLVYDFNKFCDAEEETGGRHNLLAAIGGGSRTAGQFRLLVYACLKTENPNLRIAEAGELINRDTPMIANALQSLLTAAIGEDEPQGPPAEVPVSETPAQATA